MSGLQNMHFPTLFLAIGNNFTFYILHFTFLLLTLHPLSTKKQHLRTLGEAGTRDRWQGPLSNQRKTLLVHASHSHEVRKDFNLQTIINSKN